METALSAKLVSDYEATVAGKGSATYADWLQLIQAVTDPYESSHYLIVLTNNFNSNE